MKWREAAFYIVVEYNYDGRPVNCSSYTGFQSANTQLNTTNGSSARKRLFVVRPSEDDEFNVHVTLVAQMPDW